MNIFRRAAMAGLAALLVFGLAGCGGQNPGTRQLFTLIPSGYLLGGVGPCSCPGHPLGGLPRRSTMLKQKMTNPENTLLVDAGNFVSLHRNEGEQRSEITAAGLTHLGVQAINITLRDTRYGLDFLRGLHDSYDVPFVSANVVDKATGKPAFDPYRIFTLHGPDGKMNVAVIGVAKDAVGRYVPQDAKFDITSSPDALKKVLEEVEGKAACTILLTDADRGTVAEWLNRIEATRKVDAIVSCTLMPNRSTYATIEHIPFTTTGRQGKFFDVVTMTPHPEGIWKMAKQGYPLNETVGDDPEMVGYIDSLSTHLQVSAEPEPENGE